MHMISYIQAFVMNIPKQRDASMKFAWPLATYALWHHLTKGSDQIFRDAWIPEFIHLALYAKMENELFYISCMCNDATLVSLLLQDNRIKPNKIMRETAATPLRFAYRNDYQAVLQLLLNSQHIHPAVKQKKSDNGPFLVPSRQPLSILNVIEILLENIPQQPDKSTKIAWCYAISQLWHFLEKPMPQHHTKLIALIMVAKLGDAFLFTASEFNHQNLVAVLLQNPHTNPNECNDNGTTPFYIACKEGHIEVVRLLLADPRTDPNLEIHSVDHDDKRTPFFAACAEGHTEIVKLLLADPRIDPCKRCSRGCTPLWIACGGGHEEVVALLLKDGRIGPNIVDNGKQTPLFTACEYGNAGTVALLLADPRIDLNPANNMNQLFECAFISRSLGTAMLLLQRAPLSSIEEFWNMLSEDILSNDILILDSGRSLEWLATIMLAYLDCGLFDKLKDTFLGKKAKNNKEMQALLDAAGEEAILRFLLKEGNCKKIFDDWNKLKSETSKEATNEPTPQGNPLIIGYSTVVGGQSKGARLI